MVYYNESVLSEVGTDRSCIPSNVLSFAEAALYVNEGIEAEYNKLFEDIGVHELAVYESTGEFISYMSEADDVKKDDKKTTAGEGENKKLHERIIEWFKKIWAKIKGFFEDVIAKVKKAIADNKKNMNEKVAKKLSKADISKLPDKKYGSTYDYTEFDKVKPVATYEKRVTGIMSSIMAQFDDLSPEGDAANELYEKFKTNMVSNYMGDKKLEEESADGIKKYYRSLIPEKMVEVDKAYLSAHFDEMVKYVFTENPITEIKSMYKTSRKAIDQGMSAAKKRMNQAKKDDKVISYAQYEYRLYKDVIQYLVAENGVILDILKKRMSDYRGVLFRVALSGKKNGAFGEATENNDLFASQVALVENAFSWI